MGDIIKEYADKLFMFDNNELKITFTKNKIHIINYGEIKSFEDNKIIIISDKNKIIIRGKSLITKKLFDHEVLIEGTIISIELG